MSYFVNLTEKATEDIVALKKSNLPCYTKVMRLLSELAEHPETGTGKPELMKHYYSGCWSRRIDRANRLVYMIEHEIVTVTVLSSLGHYGDK